MKFKIIIDVINVFGRVYRKYKVVKIGNRDHVSLETISRVVSCRKFVFLRVDNGGSINLVEKMAVKIFTTLVIPFSRRGNDGAKFLIERIVFSWVDRDEVAFI